MAHLARQIIKDFIKKSWPCIEKLVSELANFNAEKKPTVTLYHYKKGHKVDCPITGDRFFLRTSYEYTNPQLILEELQGIIAARLLAVCGNYFFNYGLHEVTDSDFDEIDEMLAKPPQGVIVPFLLNTDDAEPDRYSMNPLKTSIVDSGQSAFPAAFVKTEKLEIDQTFTQKYTGTLISPEDVEIICHHLQTGNNNYVDMVDAVKYEQLEHLSQLFGIDLCLYSTRLPLTTLKAESSDNLLHSIIRDSHSDLHSISLIYGFMGRSMKKRTTLLTVPHSEKGYGSKRSVRGKIYFDDTKVKSIKIKYRSTPLYPNAIDPSDVSIAKATDHFVVEGDTFVNYDFQNTPSSPQFILYSLGSPENAVLWHAIGAFGAKELVRSYLTTRFNSEQNTFIRNLRQKFGIATTVPLQFNLTPQNIWVHPIHRNIDASVGCVEHLWDLAKMGMQIEYLPPQEYIRR